MTVPSSSNDPEIVLGGADPAPSAPPADDLAANLPTAIATPVVASSAAPLPSATAAPPLAAATTASAGGNIERTTNADGSLAVKITTTATRPNGHREVTIEQLYIPAGAASTVALSLDAGIPPSQLYLTRREQQILPPGTGEVAASRPPAYPTPGYSTTAGQPSQSNEPVVSDEPTGINGTRACGICCGIFCLIFIIAGIAGGASESSHSSSGGYSPSYPSWSPPSPSGGYRPSSNVPVWCRYPSPGLPTYGCQTPAPSISPRPTALSPQPTSPLRTFSPAYDILAKAPAYAPGTKRAEEVDSSNDGGESSSKDDGKGIAGDEPASVA